MALNVNDADVGQYNEYGEVRSEYVVGNPNVSENISDMERWCFVSVWDVIKRKMQNVNGT